MIGIDIIKTTRMSSLIDRFKDKGLQKFLSDDEISLVKSDNTAAGFWATKEAFAKAIGTGIGAECSFKDIKVYKSKKGAPLLALSKKIVDKFKIIDTSVSITHDGEYAISVVVVQTNSPTTNKVKQF